MKTLTYVHYRERKQIRSEEIDIPCEGESGGGEEACFLGPSGDDT